MVKPDSIFADVYRGRRVLVTGHTGFKGAWLCEWLLGLGAEVAGYSIGLPTEPALFEQLSLDRRLRHTVGDIRDLDGIRRLVTQFAPDFVFHLAAQSLVRFSYKEPVETYETNVMGTVNVLESIRLAGISCQAIFITTDKCYENREWAHGYREIDPMGGYDPYSSSKGAAELVISAYRRSYFSSPASPVRICSARAGNVIGGGDWARDRLVPDCMRALQAGTPILIRNKLSTRPWQHVLEPLSGYLWLGARLALDQGMAEPIRRSELYSAFNFGPNSESTRTVGDLVQAVLRHWPGEWQEGIEVNSPHEARSLHLSTDKALHLLGWRATWDFEHTVAETTRWYRQSLANPSRVRAMTAGQIENYVAAAALAKAPWAA